MGCSDSQVKVADNNEQQPPKAKVARFAPGVEDDTEAISQKELAKVKKQKSRSKSKGKAREGEGDGSFN
jgi:hypothetical protein